MPGASVNTRERGQEMAGTDIYQLLEKDHREVEQLFQRILSSRGEQAAGMTSPMALMNQLSQMLKAHMAAEERTFYASLMENSQTREIVNESRKEHEEARGLINEVSASESSVLLSRVQVLQQAIQHHVQEEEGKLFREARQVIDQQMASQIGSRFEQEKSREMGMGGMAGA